MIRDWWVDGVCVWGVGGVALSVFLLASSVDNGGSVVCSQALGNAAWFAVSIIRTTAKIMTACTNVQYAI